MQQNISNNNVPNKAAMWPYIVKSKLWIREQKYMSKCPYIYYFRNVLMFTWLVTQFEQWVGTYVLLQTEHNTTRAVVLWLCVGAVLHAWGKAWEYI